MTVSANDVRALSLPLSCSMNEPQWQSYQNKVKVNVWLGRLTRAVPQANSAFRLFREIRGTMREVIQCCVNVVEEDFFTVVFTTFTIS